MSTAIQLVWSGHDTSYRLLRRAAQPVTVDLNALLFRYESDIALLIGQWFGGSLRKPEGTVETAAAWEQRADQRHRLMREYLWEDCAALFFDYDLGTGERTHRIRKCRDGFFLYHARGIWMDKCVVTGEPKSSDGGAAEQAQRAGPPGVDLPLVAYLPPHLPRRRGR